MLPLHVQTIVPELHALALNPPRPPPPELPAAAACVHASPFMGVPGHGVRTAPAPPWPLRPPVIALSPPALVPAFELVAPALEVPSPAPALLTPAPELLAPALVEPASPPPFEGSELPPHAATLAIPSMNNAHVSLVNFI